MKQKKRAISFLLLVLLLRVTIHAFTHPGLYNNKTELDFIKKMVNEGKQPWKSGYDKMLKKVPGSFSPRADAIVGYGCSGTAAPGSWYLDGAYAYGYALQWYIKGDTNKRDNALRILNA